MEDLNDTGALEQSPAKKRFRALIFIKRFGGFILLLAFLTLAFFASRNPYFLLDLTITKFLQSFNQPWFESLMFTISEIINPGWAEALIALFFVFLIYFRRNMDSLFFIFSAFGGLLLSQTFKFIVGRPRPNPDLIEQLLKLSDESFPSGHVMYALCVFGFLFFLTFIHLKNGLLRILLMSIFAILIFLMGISRIYLGVHWFSDVVGSVILGSIWLLFVIRVYHLIVLKR